ncbi:MAG: nitroreductase [Pseudomonadota bacterium]
MELTEAVRSRYSARAFLPKEVSETTVRRVLDRAAQAPSGGNLQPWHVYALGGAALQELLREVATRLPGNPRGEPAEYDVYPTSLKEPYRTRRYRCGEDLYASIEIPRDDKLGRLRQFAKNLTCFGAPVCLFFAIDRTMGRNQWAHLGMFMQTVMLLAREEGLHTCAQEAWSAWHETVSRHVSLPEELMLYCGMALGYADEQAPINRWRTERAPRDEWCTLRGFGTG